MDDVTLLGDMLVVLACAAAVAIALQRVRMALIPAYLIAGTLIGPSALHFVRSPESLETISHLAIILLMFGIGLEMHLGAVRGGLGRMIGIGAAVCVATTLLGWPAALEFGFAPPAALAASMGLSLSSTAVVLRILASRRQVHSPWGRLALTVLVVQDLAVIAMLASIGPLAAWAGAYVQIADVHDAAAKHALSAVGVNALAQGLGRAGAVVLFVIGGSWLLPRLLRIAARTAPPEVIMILSVAIAMGASAATYALGLSLELGAFMAGLMLAGTHFRHQISGQIGPLRDLFMALFFTTLGMKLDIAVLASMWWVLPLGVLAMVLVKTLAISATAWLAGIWAPVALTVGFALAQAGEFSIIFFGGAAKAGLFDERQEMGLVSIVVISLVLTPMLMDLGARLAPRVEKLGAWTWGRSVGGAPVQIEADAPPHAIVAGFGPIGRRIAEAFAARGIAYRVIELNANTVQEEHERGLAIYFGDAANTAVLESAGIDTARAVILTVPDEHAIQRACVEIRRLNPAVFIAARVGTLLRASAAESLGADHVVVGESVMAEAMLRIIDEHCWRELGRCVEDEAERDEG